MKSEKRGIVVVGSSNTDMVVKADRLPKPGETILGTDFFINPGGKGANQAVAAARLGGSVNFIASLGNDIFGRQAIEQFTREGIQTSHVFSDADRPSGVALIIVGDQGENQIVVAGGANNLLSSKMIDSAMHLLEGAAVLLVQLEVPLEVIEYACRKAFEAGVSVVLNPAPARMLPTSLLQYVDILTPNEHEASILSEVEVRDEESALRAADAIRRKGVNTVIITMGEKGAWLCNEKTHVLVPAPKVRAVDTTAAGDVFNGALAVSIAEGRSIEEAVAFGCKAAALSVTRFGAQASAPFLSEISDSTTET